MFPRVNLYSSVGVPPFWFCVGSVVDNPNKVSILSVSNVVVSKEGFFLLLDSSNRYFGYWSSGRHLGSEFFRLDYNESAGLISLT